MNCMRGCGMSRMAADLSFPNPVLQEERKAVDAEAAQLVAYAARLQEQSAEIAATTAEYEQLRVRNCFYMLPALMQLTGHSSNNIIF